MEKNVKSLSTYALSIAIVMVATLFLKVPTPTGYDNLGGCFILVIATFVNPIGALLAGGIGSMLADIMSGYAVWAIPTLIIKGSMGFLAAILLRKECCKKKLQIKSVRVYLFAILMSLYVVAGYLIAGIYVIGTIPGSVAQTPGLLVEAVVTVITYIVAASALEQVKFRKLVDL